MLNFSHFLSAVLAIRNSLMCIILHLVSDTYTDVHAYWSEGLKERRIVEQHKSTLGVQCYNMLNLALF